MMETKLATICWVFHIAAFYISVAKKCDRTAIFSGKQDNQGSSRGVQFVPI